MEGILRAVQFDHYGGREVLYVAERAVPSPGQGELLIRVKAAGVNPGEAGIRSGAMHSRFPATFPSGEGTDFSGIVEEVGEGVSHFAAGDEVLGFSWTRSSHANFVVVPSSQVVPKPEEVSWEVAGSLAVAGSTAFAAVKAIDVKPGETVVVSGAAGGVGTIVVQLLKLHEATVIGIASDTHHEWLSAHGAVQVPYGEDLLDRVRKAAPQGVDAFIDLFGPAYIDLALELGVPIDRIETIISFQKVGELGIKGMGSTDSSKPEVLSQLAGLLASQKIDIPIAATFPLDKVQDAFELVEKRHTLGKVVLIP